MLGRRNVLLRAHMQFWNADCRAGVWVYIMERRNGKRREHDVKGPLQVSAGSMKTVQPSFAVHALNLIRPAACAQDGVALSAAPRSTGSVRT